MLIKVFHFFIGVILSIVIIIGGLLLTKLIEHGVGIFISIVLVPIIGYLFYIDNYKAIGLGMFISTVPIIIAGILFMILSSLH
ncbi:hypothetical protein [Sporocytophaga myxococcoides]|uniref:hypothetical protein n=1 Tax=Sporocytophaga myxococcoides TaxID=153721 RepID=UPI00048E3A1A|nr:hypothetical protein [Sporocytophaga myxococcoides]